MEESENLQRFKHFASKPTNIEVEKPVVKEDPFLSQAALLRQEAMKQLSELKQKATKTIDRVGEFAQDTGEFAGNLANEVAVNFKGLIPNGARITQAFGNKNPIEKFSGGVNYGTDFGVKVGTPVALPPGRWKVLESFAGAKGGKLGDSTNRGYGNSVLVQNLDTGEKMRFSHLSRVGVQPGQQVPGGVVGLTGATGNASGPHLDLEYYDQRGKIANVLKSRYASYLQ